MLLGGFWRDIYMLLISFLLIFERDLKEMREMDVCRFMDKIYVIKKNRFYY